MLKIALPNKGSLSEEAIMLVKEAGYKCRRFGRELIITDEENEVEFIFLRPRDIAVYVGNGVLSLGITGRDLAKDCNIETTELLTLRFGKSKFCYAVPEASSLTPADFTGLRIATSYVRLVENDLAENGIKPKQIVHLDGAVEIAVRLGIADLIADVIQTGKTMKEAGLKITGEEILKSEAILIGREKKIASTRQVKTFIDRLNGIIVAREYVIIEYDIDEKTLEKACVITPGIESPTISPLSRDKWFAVKAMLKKKDVNKVIDDLIQLDAKGIIVTDIRTCRI